MRLDYLRSGLAALALVNALDGACSTPQPTPEVKPSPAPLVAPSTTTRAYTNDPRALGIPQEEKDAAGNYIGVHGKSAFGDYHLFFEKGAKLNGTGFLQLKVNAPYWLEQSIIDFQSDLDPSHFGFFSVRIRLEKEQVNRLKILTGIGCGNEPTPRDGHIGTISGFNQNNTALIEYSWRNMADVSVLYNGYPQLKSLTEVVPVPRTGQSC
jgi:hypothetical protein